MGTIRVSFIKMNTVSNFAKFKAFKVWGLKWAWQVSDEKTKAFYSHHKPQLNRIYNYANFSKVKSI